MQPFDPTLRHKNGPWAWNSPYQEIKSPHSLCWTCYLVSFPASESMCAFVVLKHVCYMVSGQTHCYMCPCGEEMGPSGYSTKGSNAACQVLGRTRRPWGSDIHCQC